MGLHCKTLRKLIFSGIVIKSKENILYYGYINNIRMLLFIEHLPCNWHRIRYFLCNLLASAQAFQGIVSLAGQAKTLLSWRSIPGVCSWPISRSTPVKSDPSVALLHVFVFISLFVLGEKRRLFHFVWFYFNCLFLSSQEWQLLSTFNFFLFVYWSPLCPQPDLPALEVRKTSKVATVPKISSAEPWNYRWPPQKWLLCQIKSYSEK